MAFPGVSDDKKSACKVETMVESLDWEDSLEKGMTTHSSILAWRIPWTEEPGGPQSTGSQRVGHNRATNTCTFMFTSKTDFELSVLYLYLVYLVILDDMTENYTHTLHQHHWPDCGIVL